MNTLTAKKEKLLLNTITENITQTDKFIARKVGVAIDTVKARRRGLTREQRLEAYRDKREKALTKLTKSTNDVHEELICGVFEPKTGFVQLKAIEHADKILGVGITEKHEHVFSFDKKQKEAQAELDSMYLDAEYEVVKEIKEDKEDQVSPVLSESKSYAWEKELTSDNPFTRKYAEGQKKRYERIAREREAKTQNSKPPPPEPEIEKRGV